MRVSCEFHVVLPVTQRLDAKLSDQQVKIQDGNIPMPLYTCLHVKKHVSAMIFHGKSFNSSLLVLFIIREF